MKILVFQTIIAVLLLSGCKNKESTTASETNVYTLKVISHSSLSPLIDITIPTFEREHNCTVNIVLTTESGDMLTELKDHPDADIILGLDNNSIAWALEEKIAIPYKPVGFESINEDYHFDKTYSFIPFTYGYYAFIYDSYLIDEIPDTFGKVQDGNWKNSFLISDPRSSSTGLGFLLWSVSMFGETGYRHFWRSVKNNIYFTSPLWEQSWSMFLAGEAPIVLGFTTTPAYYMEIENSYRYKSFIPDEGAYMYIEGVGILESSSNIELAQKFVDFVVGREFQRHIPAHRWLYPVYERINLPSAYDEIDIPEILVNKNIVNNLGTNKINTWMNRWSEIMMD